MRVVKANIDDFLTIIVEAKHYEYNVPEFYSYMFDCIEELTDKEITDFCNRYFDTDDEIDNGIEQLYDLRQLYLPDMNYRSYDDIEEEFDIVDEDKYGHNSQGNDNDDY
jgi:hypothetical protein